MDLNNKLIICPSEVSRVFLSLKRNDPYLNVTVFSLKELQKQIFGSYDKDAIKYLLINTKYPVKQIKEILNLIQKGIDPNASKEIKEVYELLVKNDLLETNDLIKELFKNNDVLVIGYIKENIELNHVLDKLTPKSIEYVRLEEVVQQENKSLIKFKTIDEEVRYVFNSIIDEDVKAAQKGEKTQKKCIVCDDKKYEPYLKTFASAYNVKLYFKNSKSIVNTSIAKGLLKEALLGNDLNFYLNGLRENASEGDIEIINSLIKVINDYLRYIDEDGKEKYVNNLYENLKFLIDEIKIKEPHYENEILVTSSIELNPNLSYFVLGASDTFLPSLKKNNKLLDDIVLEKSGINSSTILNKEIEVLSKNFLYSLYVKHVSYYVQEGKDKNYFTNYVTKEQVIEPLQLKYDYSKASTASYYSKAVDIQKKYSEETFDLNYKEELDKNGVSTKSYDSSFGGVTQNNPKRNLSFSYTSLSSLYSCPFKYYIDYVLNIGCFEDTFQSKLGKFVHKMFEYVYKYDFFKSYEVVFKEFKDQFDAKELLLLDADKKRIQYGYENLRKHIYTNSVNKSEHEFKNTYDVVPGDHSLTVNGSIDNFIIMYPLNQIMILDYKTGSYTVGTEEDYDAGMNLQLLMYSYLLSKDDAYKNLEIAGIYYCPIITKELNTTSKKFYDSYKLDGLTFIEGYTSEEVFTKSSTKIKTTSINDYRLLVEEKVKNAESIVRDGKFNIKPYINKKNDPCKFCEYSSICFKNKALENIYKVEVEGGEEDEE